MMRQMLQGGHPLKILWTIVTAIMVQVVHMIFCRHVAVEHAMLVGFNVTANTNAPPKAHVSVRGLVPGGLTPGNLLTRRKLPN